ncbi:MAG: CocE/NonD family hydrolase [Cyclobacteriaceae bacterium]|nr:CocE/NonD family hydrolase [Cyclobacteriaceae bacterium]
MKSTTTTSGRILLLMLKKLFFNAKVILFIIPVIMTMGIPSFAQQPLRDAFPFDDFTIREEMIPMRDGVRLYTIILSPKNIKQALPMMLERTPYNAANTIGGPTANMDVVLGNKYIGDTFIYVFQDIRGRFKSEGENLLYRVPRGNFNKTNTDETTDAWDTIDWLVKNIKSNGKVGVWGTSYPGWLTLAALRDPHPALAAAVPFNPVVDVWKADDWFHWGAFRATYGFDYIYEMQTRSDEPMKFPHNVRDNYIWTLDQGAAGTGLSKYLDKRYEMWARLMENPAYGPYWKDVAADRWFDAPPRIVPTMHVHGLWDQEDIYGSPAVYATMEKHDTSNDRNFFVAGPWYHGQHFADGSKLGDISFGENTSKRFREDVLKPFLNHFLHATDEKLPAPVTVFETGTNRWNTFEQWPPMGTTSRLYLQPEGKLSFTPPVAGEKTTDFTADPAKPVPYAPRPNWAIDYDNPTSIAKWRRWLVEDQRFVDGRPDVATWVGDPLTEQLTIRGPVLAKLLAETTGTDADWVVKLIDVYPDDSQENEMSGYQLMISADIFRGRYREDFEQPKPLAADKALSYTIPLPIANHTFKQGHRLMVQIQSSWFPLYDRNPQTYVESIMTAPEKAYQKQRHRVHHNPNYATYLEFNVYRD